MARERVKGPIGNQCMGLRVFGNLTHAPERCVCVVYILCTFFFFSFLVSELGHWRSHPKNGHHRSAGVAAVLEMYRHSRIVEFKVFDFFMFLSRCINS